MGFLRLRVQNMLESSRHFVCCSDGHRERTNFAIQKKILFRWLRIKLKCFFFLLSAMSKVAPAELEALLLTHPEIEDAAVVP